MSASIKIAIAGATGVVGNEMLRILEERAKSDAVKVDEVKLFASANSAGEVYNFLEEEIRVEELTAESFQGVDYALFALGGSLSEKFVPAALDAGATVIDNSSAFRMKEDVPLVVPEVNGDLLGKEDKLIANPNCTTAQLVPVLDLIEKNAGLERVVVSTYQAFSGAGKAALDELWNQTREVFTQQQSADQEDVVPAFQHHIAFNCIPQIDVMLDNRYSKEEMKVIEESRKILRLPELRITATAVRVPVFHGHGESISVETKSPLSPEAFIEILTEAEGIEVFPQADLYPMQVDAATTDPVYVGRVRQDFSVENGLHMWIVADNLRKGAALNAVQILEQVLTFQ